MLFERKKPLDLILETAEKRSLNRQLGAFELTMLGIGAVIGTGIFVLTAVAANKAGPGMMYSFVIAGIVCALTALVYAEIASMVPVAGSAYTYSYAVLGEIIAWMVGWALILEYAVAAGAVAVGWSGYANGFLRAASASALPLALTAGPGDTITLRRRHHRRTARFNLVAFLVVAAGHLAAGDRHLQVGEVHRGAGGRQDHRADRLHRRWPCRRCRAPTSSRCCRTAGAPRCRAWACWAPRRRSSSPTSASTRCRPPPRKPRTRTATSRSA